MIAEKDFAGRQACGSREYQEDAYAFSDILGEGNQVEGLLVVLADGMGGHTSGDQASKLALESFVSAFHAAGGTLSERLRHSVIEANSAIARKSRKSPELEGMGTTLLAAGMTQEGVEWISVGDSPLYLWRDGALNRLNADHSFRPMLRNMMETGELTPADVAKHPFRNLLRAALNGEEIELIDQPGEPVALRDGDLIIAASDGVQTLNDEDIAVALANPASPDAAALASGLLQAVLDAKHPKQDNITIAIIRAGSGGFVAREAAPVSKGDTHAMTIFMNPMKRNEPCGN
jgi:protein phosphatase